MSPRPFTVTADDGQPLAAWHWSARGDGARPLVVVCPATAVACRHYAPFAGYLCRHGFDVVTFDYRGIGGSRPPRLRGFKASAIDWGCHDLEAVLRHLLQAGDAAAPLLAVGHSIGGLVLGLAPSAGAFRRVFTVGAQYAHWRDYAAAQRWRMRLKWHLAMPLLTAACGYFPGRALGWMEDTPAGVVWDWSGRSARFERRCVSALRRLDDGDRQALVERLASRRAPMLALSFTDDPFASVTAVERLLRYFERAPRRHLRLDPTHFGEAAVGHFGFFRPAFEQRLWPLALAWLRGDDAVQTLADALVEPRRLPAAGWQALGA